MTKTRQREVAAPTFPLRVRSLALWCLLLVGLVSTAQVAHIHGRWLPDNAAQVGAPADASQTPGGEEHCPLCVAMHSALPVATTVATVHVELAAVMASGAATAVPEGLWHYDLFSRPPPVTHP